MMNTDFGIERATYLSYPSCFEPLRGTPFCTQIAVGDGFVIHDCRRWHGLDWNSADILNALEGLGRVAHLPCQREPQCVYPRGWLLSNVGAPRIAL